MSSACSTCGAGLPADSSAGGLCPSCLFAQVIADVPDELLDGRDESAFAPGSSFGRFRIESVLGVGGMSTVYQAFERDLDRTVALKILPPEFLHDDGTFARRFQQEARVVAALEHSHIVPLYASGIEGGIPWMSMRLCGGGSLGALIARKRLTVERTLEILRAVASALDHAHSRGVVHRDVKPTNVLLDTEGHVCVGDFGLAQLVEQTHVRTRTGVIAGTPHYMAPEMGLGRVVDRRADVYSLGVVAYEMLSGRPPFDAGSPVAILLKHANDPMPPPEGDNISRSVTKVLRKALAKDPAQRWPTAGSFVQALEEAVAVPVPWWRESPVVTAGASLAVVLALALWFAVRPWPVETGGSDRPPGVPAPQTDSPEASDIALPRDGAVQPATDPGPDRPPDTPASVPRLAPSPSASSTPAGTAAAPPAAEPASIPPPAAAAPFVTGDAPAPPQPVGTPSDAPPTPAGEPPPVVPAPTPEPKPSTAQPQQDVVIPPVRTRTVDPVYPPLARAAQMEGEVLVKAVVQPDGRVTDVEVVRSVHPILDAAAIDAVRQYGYRPGLRNGVAEAFEVEITVKFSLTP